jgi:hypothetical protein
MRHQNGVSSLRAFRANHKFGASLIRGLSKHACMFEREIGI